MNPIKVLAAEQVTFEDTPMLELVVLQNQILFHIKEHLKKTAGYFADSIGESRMILWPPSNKYLPGEIRSVREDGMIEVSFETDPNQTFFVNPDCIGVKVSEFTS